MNWNRRIRQVHRWTSIIFTFGVIANIISIFGMGQEQPPVWVGMMALVPLVLLLLTGLYMFALHYLTPGGLRRAIGRSPVGGRNLTGRPVAPGGKSGQGQSRDQSAGSCRPRGLAACCPRATPDRNPWA